MYISQNKFDLNLPLFIARRMRLNPNFKGSVSVQIIKIAKVAVALGIMMILIAVAMTPIGVWRLRKMDLIEKVKDLSN